MSRVTFHEVVHRAPRGEAEPARRVADLGIGRGGAATPPRPRETSREISDSIRRAAALIRGRASLDDLLGNS